MLSTIVSRLEAELEETRQPIPILKAGLNDARADLVDRFNQGESTETLVHEHSEFMDRIMQLAWSRFTWNENLKSWRKSRISLVAVGGYGRKELFPHSDIDLLVLLERNNYASHRVNIQSFLTLLWDIGLEVGHSVRSISECKSQAANDVTVLTAMMESRTLCGSEDLLKKMNKQIAPNKVWSAKSFFQAKRDEQADRHRKSAHTEYSLEPNIKSSPGGLRDIQTLTWIAKRQFGVTSIPDLAEQGVLVRDEVRELIECRKLLWQIRFALHTMSGRDENRLLFEHQQKLATQFGYVDGAQLAVEQFMQAYYRTAQRVNTISDLMLQLFDEAIIRAKERLTVRPINPRFRLLNNLLEVTSDDVFKNDPSALIEMFVIIGHDDSIDGLRGETIRLARQHVHLIDDDFRADPDNAELFIKLLGSNNHLFTQLRRMNRYGILGAYLPEFGRVIGQMQFDLFHIYTVDAHTLQVVRNMRRFRYKNQEQEFPIAAHIHPRLPRIELLYIAGLYHDIAKGMGGDHSDLGEDIARSFCERHDLGTWDTNLVCWLVKNHLVMSTTAQRKDIQDPDVIHQFASFVGDQVRLDYLYALTVADINATNPTLWNGWRASLMRQLYSETKKALRHGLEEPVDRNEYIQEIQQQAIARLEDHDIPRDDIVNLWNQVDDDYFIRERVPDIVWQTEGIMSEDVNEGPVILIHDDKSRRSDAGYTQIFIHTRDKRDLFVATVSAIDKLGLDIVDARIATSIVDLTFNTFTVLEADGQPVGDRPARIDKIRNTIKQYLSMERIDLKKTRRTPRALKQFKMKTEVTIRQDAHLPQTVLEVVTPDRPGLLAVVASVFVEFDINLVTARITTLGERVEDVFYITDQDGRQITDADAHQRLITRISEELDEHVEKIAV